MSNDERRPGHLWVLVQDWMDAIPYPPSQRKLAARIEVSPSALSDWKYGDGFPDPASLGRLAAEIGVPYERVLDAVLKDRGYRQADRKEGDRDVRPAATKAPDSGPGNVIEIAGQAARNTGKPTRAQQRKREAKDLTAKDEPDPS